MSERLILAVPSKGRLMDQAAELFSKAGLELRKVGSQRGYRGEIAGFDDVEVVFMSASEITALLKAGRAHLGVTGEDLVRETMADADSRVSLLVPLGFGRADVVVAVPAAWIDVRRMADLEAAAMLFQRTHGRRLRVATKYMNLTRRFFAAKGVTGYRIVESSRRHGRHAGGRRRRADRRHHHDRRHAQGQWAEGAGRRRDPEVAGPPGGV